MTTTSVVSPEPQTKPPGMSLRRVVVIAVGVVGGIFLLLFLVALGIALFSPDVERASATIRAIRDLMIIFLALEGILIILALALLILQIAQLVALLTTEIKPILENTQETLKTAQGTVQFVSETVTTPIIRTSAVLAAFSAFTREAFGLRRAVRRVRRDQDVA